MEASSLPLRVVCSDELGQLKVVQAADGSKLDAAAPVARWGQPDKSAAIDCIALGSRSGSASDTAGAVLAVARASGVVELLSPLSGQVLATLPAAPPAPGAKPEAARVRGLHLLWAVASAPGSSEGKPPSSSNSSLPAVLSVTRGGAARLHTPPSRAAASDEWEQRAAWQTPPDVCCSAYCPTSNALAVGCQGAELKVYDASSGELVFAAKGGKPNKVRLVDRPWNTAVAFLPPSPSTSSSVAAAPAADSSGSSRKGGRKAAGAAPPAAAAEATAAASAAVLASRVLVGTAHHKVRLYDAAVGKRPQMDVAWGEARITTLAVEPGGQRCWVGSGSGQLEVLDLQAGKFQGGIRGIAGSLRGLAVHPHLPLLASVGLDRYLRLHHTTTRQPLAKVYLKTQLTGVQFCPADASCLHQPAGQQHNGSGGSQAAGEGEQPGGEGQQEAPAGFAEDTQQGAGRPTRGGSGSKRREQSACGERQQEKRQRKRAAAAAGGGSD